MRSSSFIRYPGGKDKLKHHIIPELIARRNGSMQYREPFCGGFSIGIQYLEHTADSIWLNDRDPGIHALWASVIQEPDALCTLVRDLDAPTVELFNRFKAALLDADAIGRMSQRS